MGNFYEDVITKDIRFNSIERISDPMLLEPVIRGKVSNIICDAKAQGIELMIFETFRSQARQEMLFNQGATELRKVGVHNFGLACDIVKNINGQPSWKGDFSILGRLAYQYKLIWGGDWGNPNIPHDFVDNVHVQRCSINMQAPLFSLQWYPDVQYNPYS